MKRWAGTWLALAGLLAFPKVVAAPVLLGVLEEAPSLHDPSKLATDLRAAFRKEASGWEPICASKAAPPWDAACNLPQANDVLQWTLLGEAGIDGRITTQGWIASDDYAAEGILRVTSPLPPVAGPRSLDYAGWSGQPVSRPRIAIRGASPREGSNWREIAATRADAKRAFAKFQLVVPTIPACARADSGKRAGRPRPTRFADIQVIKAFGAPDGRVLVGLRVARELARDCYERGGFASDAWFLISAAGGAQALPGWRGEGWPASTMPIAIGDFDSDGREEALFWFSGYNEDGFLLFDQAFTRVRRFTWSYH